VECAVNLTFLAFVGLVLVRQKLSSLGNGKRKNQSQFPKNSALRKLVFTNPIDELIYVTDRFFPSSPSPCCFLGAVTIKRVNFSPVPF